MLRDSLLSVVIQGPVDKKNTLLCAKSARRAFPKAEIILSTWLGSKVDQIEKYVDKVVFSPDPGGHHYGMGSILLNLNRQLISTKVGLKYATRPYILKLRSDLYVGSNALLKIQLPKIRNKKFAHFKGWLCVSNLFTRKCIYARDGSRVETPFLVTDWWHFGLAEDVKLFYDCPLPDESSMALYWARNDKGSKPDPYDGALWRYSSEQYITSNCARKKIPDFTFDNYLDTNQRALDVSSNYIVNNFFVLDPAQSNIHPLKPTYKRYDYRMEPGFLESFYSPKTWWVDYKNLVDPSLDLKNISSRWERLDSECYLKFIRSLHDLRWHVSRFSNSIKRLPVLMTKVIYFGILFLWSYGVNLRRSR